MTNIEWDRDDNFVSDSNFTDADISLLEKKYEEYCNGSLTHIQRSVHKDLLNKRQRLAHDMIVKACLIYFQ